MLTINDISNSKIKNEKVYNIKSISKLIHVKIPEFKTQLKITDKEFKIPNYKDYDMLLQYNYTVPMLKNICEKYNITKNGNKQELKNNIYLFLYASNSIKKIQKKFRMYLNEKLNILHGPANNNKNLCVNDTDFLTMENLNEIPDFNFYSFIDDDKIIYGFDVNSLISAIKKDTNFRNPYNRKNLPISKIIKDINSIVRLNKIFNLKDENTTNTSLSNELSTLSIAKKIELKFLSICQKIDELGNYTDVNWFISLNRSKTIKFITELYDIWSYRAQLTYQIKRNICPNGEPCSSINLYELNIISIENLKFKMIYFIENLIYNGINRDSQYLGASYVLSALTLVNESAAESMPWLYYSVAHI